jgi:hypothetical protein
MFELKVVSRIVMKGLASYKSIVFPAPATITAILAMVIQLKRATYEIPSIIRMSCQPRASQ